MRFQIIQENNTIISRKNAALKIIEILEIEATEEKNRIANLIPYYFRDHKEKGKIIFRYLDSTMEVNPMKIAGVAY